MSTVPGDGRVWPPMPRPPAPGGLAHLGQVEQVAGPRGRPVPAPNPAARRRPATLLLAGRALCFPDILSPI